jgi:hypothetical protein
MGDAWRRFGVLVVNLILKYRPMQKFMHTIGRIMATIQYRGLACSPIDLQ